MGDLSMLDIEYSMQIRILLCFLFIPSLTDVRLLMLPNSTHNHLKYVADDLL